MNGRAIARVGGRRSTAPCTRPTCIPTTARRGCARPTGRSILLPESLHDPTGPVYGDGALGGADADLTRQHDGEPLGERIIVTGRVLDGDGRPVPRRADRDLAGERRRPLPAPASTSTRRRSTRTSPAPAAA